MNREWRRSILYATTMGMEGCWLYALMALLNERVAGGQLSTIRLLLVYPLAFGGNMLLKRLRWHRVGTASLSWLAGAVVMLLAVKIELFSGGAWFDTDWLRALLQAISQMLYAFSPELLILVSSAGLWWLGRRLAHVTVNFAASVIEFQFGLTVLLILFFVASQLEVDPGDSVLTAVSFFLFALLGMSLAHAQEGAGWLSAMYRGQWFGLLLVSLGLVISLGCLISAAITPDLLQVVLSALGWVWGLIWELIFKVLAFIVSLFPEPEPGTLPPAPPLPPKELERFVMWSMPESVRNGLRLGLSILWLGLIVVALWRLSEQAYGWLRRRWATMAGAEIEPLPGAFRTDLLRWLKWLFLNWLRLRLPFRLTRKSRPLPEVASVHQIYRQLLRWAAAGGYPRHVAQTPYEYLDTLVGLLPGAKPELALITQQFVSTRYGGGRPAEDDLQQLRQSWHQISQSRLRRPTG